jgi:nitrite reductase/ring-hydroxylating ferredoxin subunit
MRPKESGLDQENYRDVGRAGDLDLNQSLNVVTNGERIIITRLADGLYAFSAICPHAAGDLGNGSLYRGRIDCPDHGYRFDVRSGRVLWPPDEVCRLRRYEVSEVDDRIKIRPFLTSR